MPELLDTRRYVGVFGASGTGKTQAARAVVTGRVLGPGAPERWPRRGVFDPADDYVEGVDVEKVLHDHDQVYDYLRGMKEDEPFSFAYRPPLPKDSERDTDVAERAEARELGWLSRVAFAVGDCVLLVDEAAEAAGQYCRPATIRLAKRGRHRRTSVVLCSQRPHDVRPSLRGEAYADEVYLFRLGRREDLRDVAADSGREIADQVSRLPNLECLRLRPDSEPMRYRLELGETPASLPWLVPVGTPAREKSA